MSTSSSNINPDCSWKVHATDYVRGELDGAVCKQFEEHLASCPSCRLEVEETTETIQIFCAAPDIISSTPDPGLPERVLAQVPEHEWTRGDKVRRHRYAAVCAVAVAASVVVAVSLLFRTPNDEPVPGDLARLGPAGSKMKSSEPEKHEEDSVIIRARNWLVSAQEPDGSWDPDRWGGNPSFRVALTGLALLALSGDGRDPSRKAISRATGFLLQNQGKNGLIGKSFRSALYNHSIGTLALIEANRLQPTAGVPPAIDQALSFLLNARTPSGVWGYIGDNRTAGSGENESISAWALQALVRAQSADLEIDAAAIEKGFQWFEQSLTSPSARRRYRGWAGHECGHESLRPITIWAIVVRNKPGAPTKSVRLATDHVARVAFSENDQVSFYESYFLLKTLSALGRPALGSIRSRVQQVLENSQVREGSLAGSWEPKDQWSPVGGRLYSTALAALALKNPEVRAEW